MGFGRSSDILWLAILLKQFLKQFLRFVPRLRQLGALGFRQRLCRWLWGRGIDGRLGHNLIISKSSDSFHSNWLSRPIAANPSRFGFVRFLIQVPFFRIMLALHAFLDIA